jgi:hypothetical protein
VTTRREGRRPWKCRSACFGVGLVLDGDPLICLGRGRNPFWGDSVQINMRVERAAAAAFLVLALTACASETMCQDPPVTERVAPVSDLVLTVIPKAVEAGSQAELSMESPRFPSDDAITGAGAAWQCWDGVAWIDTHQLVKDEFGPNHRPAALEAEPGATTTIPGIGLPVTNSHTIVIPDVAPGIYRIRDEVWFGSDPEQGYLVVEVR